MFEITVLTGLVDHCDFDITETILAVCEQNSKGQRLLIFLKK